MANTVWKHNGKSEGLSNVYENFHNLKHFVEKISELNFFAGHCQRNEGEGGTLREVEIKKIYKPLVDNFQWKHWNNQSSEAEQKRFNRRH